MSKYQYEYEIRKNKIRSIFTIPMKSCAMYNYRHRNVLFLPLAIRRHVLLFTGDSEEDKLQTSVDGRPKRTIFFGYDLRQQ